jgi:hypothetical protein
MFLSYRIKQPADEHDAKSGDGEKDCQ